MTRNQRIEIINKCLWQLGKELNGTPNIDNLTSDINRDVYDTDTNELIFCVEYKKSYNKGSILIKFRTTLKTVTTYEIYKQEKEYHTNLWYSVYSKKKALEFKSIKLLSSTCLVCCVTTTSNINIGTANTRYNRIDTVCRINDIYTLI